MTLEKRAGGLVGVTGVGAAASRILPAWILRRALCCLGALVLMQNVMLLHWTSRLLAPEGGLSLVAEHGSFARHADGGLAAEQRVAELEERLKQSEVQLMQMKAAADASPASLEDLSKKDDSSWQIAELQRQLAATIPKSQLAAMVPKAELEVKDQNIRSLEAKLQAATAGMVSPTGQASPQAPGGLTAALPTMKDLEPSTGSLDAGTRAGSRQLHRESSLFSVPREELRLFGHEVPTSVSITVGFGSVMRKKDYVLDTVGTMLGLRGEGQGKVTEQERRSVVIVAHFADFNTDWVKQISAKLQEDYGDLIRAGHFHGIHAKQELYPDLEFCPPFCTYKDEPKRVKWRSKQNVDYAFLMYYAANLAPYYLQIEDDISFAPNWIQKMSDYLRASFPPNYLSKENAPWRLIDFSQLGFIGKMFQSNELTRMAQFLLLFYDQMPCDLLLGQFQLAMTQGKKIEYWKAHPSLFQHVGIFRSLGGFQPLQERKFGKLLFDNPPGAVISDMEVVPTYESKFVYFSGGEPEGRNDKCDFKASPQKTKVKRCWFWAKHPQIGNHMTLVFESEIGVKAVFIEFGSDKHPKDLLQQGAIQVAACKLGTAGCAGHTGSRLDMCGDFHHLLEVTNEKMVYWEEGASSPKTLPVPKVKCLRIAVTKAQTDWAIVWQIQIRSRAQL
eukprot:TRINITY_DN8139_c1_g4_i1.p1 TRINITY_DN8139_c1_g4~~TRINITY_DN8139_c1_g4_i1.p1  ORF type:complete len:672 (+),score=129.97 TRINITY_DN8139_c1_g4_i1:79-2094(+)